MEGTEARNHGHDDPILHDAATTLPNVAAHVLVSLTEWVVFAAVAVELAVLFANLVARSFLGFSLLWSQEIAQVCLSVIAFVGGGLAYTRNLHTRVEAGITRSPQYLQGLFRSGAEWIVILTCGIVAATATGTLKVASSELTPILRLSGVWFVVPLILGSLLVCVFALERLAHLPARDVVLSGIGVAVIAVVASFAGPALAPALGDGGALWISLAVLCILLFMGVPIAFVLTFGSLAYLLVSGQGAFQSVPLAMEGGVDSFVLLAIPFFILAGVIMTEGGLTRVLARAVSAFVGHLRGGLLFVTVLTMYIFAGISGSKAADIAAVGSAMKDMLADGGYNTEEGVSVLTAACVMGETVPPSLPMLVLGSVTTLSIGSLFAAGILPAIWIGLFLMGLIFIRARTQKMPVTARAPWSERVHATIGAIPVLIVPIILVGGIISGVATATESSSIAVIYALILAFLRRPHLTLGGMKKVFVDAAGLGGMVLFIVSASTPFSQTLTVGGIPQDIAAFMGHVGSASWLFLLLSVFGLVIMGELLEGLPAVLVFAPLLVPLAPTFGVDPLHYAIVILIAMGIGSVAPPIGVGMFVACAVSGSTMERSIRRQIPYLLVVCFGLVVLAFIPEVSLWLPHMLGFH